MTSIEYRLGLAGLALFFLALLQGFFIPAFDRVDVARAAHATALGSGTFLVVVGMLWPKLTFPRRLSSIWAATLAISLYTIAAGLTLMSTYPSGGEATHRTASLLTSILNTAGAVALVVALIALMFACKPRAP